MTIRSYVKDVPGASREAEHRFLPCGHTVEQGAWLGCTERACRERDEAISERYKQWVRAGKPEGRF